MKIRSLLLAAAAFSAIAGAASAQATDNAQADAKVKFITAMQVSSAGTLNFGTWIKPTSAGSMSIATDGTRSGGTTQVTDSANLPSVPTFTVVAEGGQGMSLTIEKAGMTSGYDLDTFNVEAVAGNDCGTVTATTISFTAGTGEKTCSFKVGATLDYPQNAAGALTVGAVKATVTYE
jgi:opacity protein-like surface antigen